MRRVAAIAGSARRRGAGTRPAGEAGEETGTLLWVVTSRIARGGCASGRSSAHPPGRPGGANSWVDPAERGEADDAPDARPARVRSSSQATG